MADTNRQMVLDAVGAALATITPSNGYRSIPALVERGLRDWAEVGSGILPWIGYAPSPTKPTNFEHQPGGEVKVTLPVIVVAHTNSPDQATKTRELADLEDDIIAALCVNQGLGGACSSFRLLSSETDEAEIDVQDSKGGSGTLLLNFESVFFRTIGMTP